MQFKSLFAVAAVSGLAVANSMLAEFRWCCTCLQFFPWVSPQRVYEKVSLWKILRNMYILEDFIRILYSWPNPSWQILCFHSKPTMLPSTLFCPLRRLWSPLGPPRSDPVGCFPIAEVNWCALFWPSAKIMSLRIMAAGGPLLPFIQGIFVFSASGPPRVFYFSLSLFQISLSPLGLPPASTYASSLTPPRAPLPKRRGSRCKCGPRQVYIE